jgi:protocatechuate 3,4-dioxygenase beta subunit
MLSRDIMRLGMVAELHGRAFMMRTTGSFGCLSSWRKNLVAVVILLVAWGLLTGDGIRRAAACEDPPPEAANEPSPKGPLKFVVRGTIRSEKGEPIPGARISVIVAPKFSPREEPDPYRILATTSTDKHGTFLFPEVPVTPQLSCQSGRMEIIDTSVVIQADGYELTWRSIKDESPLDLKLRRGETIAGRLLNPQGKPWSGVPVRGVGFHFLSKEEQRIAGYIELRGLEIAPQTRTDAEGRFALKGMPSRAEVRLLAGPHPTRGMAIEVNTTDRNPPKPEKSSSRGEARHDPTQGREFTLTVRAAREVRCKLICSDTREPLVGARIVLMPTWQHATCGSTALTSDQSGEFRTNELYANAYEIVVTAPEGSPYLGFRATRPLKNPVSDFSFQVPRGIPISGEVVDETSGQGVPNVTIRHTSYGLVTQDQEIWEFDVRSVQSDPKGKFTILVASGSGKIGVQGASQPYRVPSSGSHEESSGNSAVRYSHNYSAKQGTVPPPARFVIGKGFLISGRIVTPDMKPVPKAKVFVSSGWGVPEITTSDAEGRYQLRVINDKKFDVYAVQVEQKLKTETDLEIPAERGKSEYSQDIVVRPTASVRLRVTRNGKAEPGASIQVQGAKSSYPVPAGGRSFNMKTYPLNVEASSNADGLLTVRNIAVSTADQWYFLHLSLPGEQSRSERITDFKPGHMLDLGTVELTPQLGLEVTVVDPNGKPVEGVTVDYESVGNKRRGYFIQESQKKQRSDKNGTIRLYDLPPGGIKLLPRVYDPEMAPVAPGTVQTPIRDDEWVTIPFTQKMFRIQLKEPFLRPKP